MQPFKQYSGIIAPMPEANIDTDVIMPKQFLKGIDRQGLDKGVFYDLRFTGDGQPDATFVLNRPEWRGARFLLVGPNFGCGSSREHAVWGLKQLGICGLIGSSFAGIFDDNCQRNGIVTITLSDIDLSKLSECATNPATNQISVSLENGTISSAAGDIAFTLSGLKRQMLMGGEDSVAWTLQFLHDIEQFEDQHVARQPWLKRAN
jgi:3-isopropylmalate/(R)-2-methylmalate dehydratase small subunit